MANTEQAAEPTMEEILSSIRRIISDENGENPGDEEASEEVAAAAVEVVPEDVTEAESVPDPEPDQEPEDESEEEVVQEEEAELEAAPEPEPEVEEPAESPEEPQSEETEAKEDDIFELTDVVDEAANDDQPEQAANDDLELVSSEPEPAPEPVPEPQPVPVAAPAAQAQPTGDVLTASPIVSDNTQDAAMAAFNVLAGSLLTKDGSARTLEDLVQLMLQPMLKVWLDENLPGMVERLVQDEIERISRGHR